MTPEAFDAAALALPGTVLDIKSASTVAIT
jgi:hypothetical protein